MKFTKVNMAKGNRMIRVGFGQNNGKLFFRLDLWVVGYRITRKE